MANVCMQATDQSTWEHEQPPVEPVVTAVATRQMANLQADTYVIGKSTFGFVSMLQHWNIARGRGPSN